MSMSGIGPISRLLFGAIILGVGALPSGVSMAQSVDDLFYPADDGGEPAAKPGGGGSDEGGPPDSIEDLFGDGEGQAPAPGGGGGMEGLFGVAPAERDAGVRVSGFFQNEMGYVFSGDEHWQKFRNTLQLHARGRFDSGIKWHASARVFYDPIFDWTNFYPDDVRDDRRLEGTIRETYVDIPAGKWDFRLGRQHIVWGEMVGLFFADVVSAKDMREFVLPDFDLLRIPQWAIRAEYFEGNFHGEVVWIPIMTYDDIGEPGDDYFPFDAEAVVNSSGIPGLGVDVDAGDRPADSLDNSGFGLRFNWLKNGWDTSAFYYTALDSVPAFERRILLPQGGRPLRIEFERVHRRVHQLGGTLAKDFGNVVLKGEFVYGLDRPFSVTRVDDDDGLVRLDTIDYVVGLDFNFPHQTNFNAQFFQRHYTDFDDDIAVPETKRTDSGFSLFLQTDYFHRDVTPEVILISSLERDDWLLQAKVTWGFRQNWRLVGGVDVFDGPDNGLFGRFADTDRVYTELRYTF